MLSAGGNANTSAITWLSLDTVPGSAYKDVELYRDVAEEWIETALERVPGVSQSNVFGGYERELQVVIDPQSMATRQLTVSQIAAALARENINISAGSFDEGKRRYIVRTVGQYKSLSDLEHVVIRGGDGSRVRVGDIARIELGYARANAAVRQKGKPAIAVNATRETGANVLEVMEGIRQTVDELNKGPLKREGLYLRQV